MLKLRYLFENYDLAKEALFHWRHDTEHLDEALSWFRISSNAIYPFYKDQKVCFLRLAPVEEKLERNVRGELEFICWLNSRGYHAAKPIASDAGEIMLRLDSKYGSYYACVFEHVGGIQIEKTDYSDQIMRCYGKALGELHALSACYEPQIRKWSHEDALVWIGDMLHTYPVKPCVLNELAAVRAALSALPKTPQTYGLVHYDFEPDNVFFDKENQRCGVIDFDDGMYHWYALDLEQTFEEMSEALEGERLSRAKRAFISGYAAAFPYSADTEQLLPLMRRFCNLYAYARLIRAVDERFEEEPDWLVCLRKKLDAKCMNYEHELECTQE